VEIRLYQLKEGILTNVNQEYDAKQLELELVDLKFLTKLTFEGTALKESNLLTVRGVLKSKVKRICGRTLKEVEEDLIIPFENFYTVDNQKVIDTTEDFREAVLLEQPMVYYSPGSENLPRSAKPVKKKKTSEQSLSDHPFAKLKDLKKSLKEGKKHGAS
jgi:uncharacterized metal-binding protein YceD (DUF177 family)